MKTADSEQVAESIADRVWRMHHLDKEETIAHLDWEQFTKQVLKLLKPITDARAEPLEVLRSLRSFFTLNWRLVLSVHAKKVGGYAAAEYTTFIETTLNTADALLGGARESER